MACNRCGHTGCWSYHTCPVCSPNKAPSMDPKSGKQLGEGIAGLLLWLAGNKFLAFFWFWLAWFILATTIGVQTGIAVNEEGYSAPDWFNLVAAVVPIIVAIFLRKPIMKYVPLILTTLVGIAGVGLYIGVVVLLCYIVYKMLS